jgi:hypothetical protein
MIHAIIALLFPFHAFADWFTNPPSFVNPDLNATNNQKLPDLHTTFTLGQTVEISWNVPASTVPFVSLSISHWDVKKSVILYAFLSSFVREIVFSPLSFLLSWSTQC